MIGSSFGLPCCVLEVAVIHALLGCTEGQQGRFLQAAGALWLVGMGEGAECPGGALTHPESSTCCCATALRCSGSLHTTAVCYLSPPARCLIFL